MGETWELGRIRKYGLEDQRTEKNKCREAETFAVKMV